MPWSGILVTKWRWNFLNISFSFRVTRTQNRDGQTDRQTDIHTDRQTVRQTPVFYYIDKQMSLKFAIKHL